MLFGLYCFGCGWAFARTGGDKALARWAHGIFRELVEEAVEIKQAAETRQIPEAVRSE
jgi:hypothetical protein